MSITTEKRGIVPEDELIDRATQAYRRRCEREGWLPSQPSNTSEVIEDDNRILVILRNVNGVLAVYRYFEGTDRISFLPAYPKCEWGDCVLPGFPYCQRHQEVVDEGRGI